MRWSKSLLGYFLSSQVRPFNSREAGNRLPRLPGILFTGTIKRQNQTDRLNNPQPPEDREHDRCSQDRTDLATGIGPHGVHQQVVLLVVLLPLLLYHPR